MCSCRTQRPPPTATVACSRGLRLGNCA
jgi:hypothetical protein